MPTVRFSSPTSPFACVAFPPFPTRLVGEHFRDDGVGAAAITYGLTVTAGAICFTSLWFYAAIDRRLISLKGHSRALAHVGVMSPAKEGGDGH